MGRNVEIKARVRDERALRARAQALCGPPERVMTQEDTFFVTARGRLKLRVRDGAHGELIYYERADEPGPKACAYRLVPVAAPRELEALLRAAFGVRGTVRKERRLFRRGQTRIHLDDVFGLGPFLEIEVVLRAGQTVEDGARMARRLMTELDVREQDLVDGAYVDLLAGG